jgi:hypothetical protein
MKLIKATLNLALRMEANLEKHQGEPPAIRNKSRDEKLHEKICSKRDEAKIPFSLSKASNPKEPMSMHIHMLLVLITNYKSLCGTSRIYFILISCLNLRKRRRAKAFNPEKASSKKCIQANCQEKEKKNPRRAYIKCEPS